jgi:hypothetical protein
VPGLVERSPNSHVRTLKEPTWCRLHALLGKGGDRIIQDMLLECAIFCPVDVGTGNFYQLSGVPMSDLKTEHKQQDHPRQSEVGQATKTTSLAQCVEQRGPSAITFVRSRMLYAKAALNAKGGVRFGMRHIRRTFPILGLPIANSGFRCSEPTHQKRRPFPNYSHTAPHLSSTIRPTQCVFFQGRPP